MPIIDRSNYILVNTTFLYLKLFCMSILMNVGYRKSLVIFGYSKLVKLILSLDNHTKLNKIA